MSGDNLICSFNALATEQQTSWKEKATRKQKREEASWYACQFKLTAPSASCMDFHSVFAGTLDKHQTEGLNEEEHMRVCNSVEAQLSKIPHVPAYKTETEAGKAKYLAWCVNNIHQ